MIERRRKNGWPRSHALTLALLLGAAVPASAQGYLMQDAMSAQDPTIVRGCHSGEVIDSTTPGQTKARLEDAGYSSVQVISKGCDNVWHARGIHGEAETRMILMPDGAISQGGN